MLLEELIAEAKRLDIDDRWHSPKSHGVPISTVLSTDSFLEKRRKKGLFQDDDMVHDMFFPPPRQKVLGIGTLKATSKTAKLIVIIFLIMIIDVFASFTIDDAPSVKPYSEFKNRITQNVVDDAAGIFNRIVRKGEARVGKFIVKMQKNQIEEGISKGKVLKRLVSWVKSKATKINILGLSIEKTES